MKTTRTSRPSWLRLRGPAAAVAAVLLVAGCGDAEEPTAPDAAASPSTSAAEPEESESESEPEESATESATESASDDMTSETEEAAAEDLVITIAEFAFEVPDSIPAGSEITVINEDSVGHTVTSDEEGVFDVIVGPGEEVAFTVPEEVGDYAFHCTPHPNMVSTLVVG